MRRCTAFGFQATSIHGLTDLFTYADHCARQRASTSEPFVRVTHWRPNGGDLECVFDSRPGKSNRPAVVIMPASHLSPVDQGRTPECVAWITRKHSDGAVLAAVCGGVFVLAESGLLAGRRATTHWMFADELGRRFPDLIVDADRLVIDDNDTKIQAAFAGSSSVSNRPMLANGKIRKTYGSASV